MDIVDHIHGVEECRLTEVERLAIWEALTTMRSVYPGWRRDIAPQLVERFAPHNA